MERRNSRAQSYPHGSERNERRKSLLEQVKDSVIDILSPSWLTDMVSQATNGSPQQPNDSHEDENGPNRDSRTNLTDSRTRGLSQSYPALYENGQPRSLDFSVSGTSQGLPSQQRNQDFAQPGTSQGIPSQPRSPDFAQPGTSQGTRNQDFAQPSSSRGTQSQDYAQPSTSRETRSQDYAQSSTSRGTRSQDYAQPSTSRGTPVLEFTSSQLPLNRLTDESDIVMAQDDTVSQRSNSSHSTSGCSSMIPQSGGSQEARQDIKRRRSSGESTLLNRGTQTRPPQPEAKRPRLFEVSNINVTNVNNNLTWTERHRQAQQDTPLRNNNPAFKPHLFGSPLANQNNPYNLRQEDCHNSPFYPGKTCYGGRNNFRSQDYTPRQRQRQNESQSSRPQWPYPVRQVVRPRPRPDTESTAVTGRNSQRIMELFSKISTPMSDARRIPVIVPRQWTAPRRYSNFLTPDSPSRSGPPTHGLQVGELASISANRQVSGPGQGQNQERQEPARPPSPQPGPSGVQGNREARNLQQDTNNQATNADGSHQQIGDERIVADMQVTRSRTILRARRTEGERFTATNLRTAPTVQVASDGHYPLGVQVNVPPVDFSVTVTNNSSAGPRYEFDFSSPIAERRRSDNSASPGTSGAFQFSSPIHLPSTSTDTAPRPKETAAFSFSGPSTLKQGFVGAGTETRFEPASALNQGSICSTGMGFMPADKLKQGSVMDVLGNSGSGFNFKPAEKLKQGSLMDVLGSSGSGFKPAGNLKQGSVMDVLNDSGSGFKPAEKLKTGSVMDILGNSGSGFKPSEKLKQGSVMDVLGGSGSGFKPAGKLKQGSVMDILGGNTGTTTQDTSTTDLMRRFAPAAGSWACNSCLLQNKPDTTHCVACQTPGPSENQTTSTTGLAPEPKSAATSTTGLAQEPKSAATSTTGLVPATQPATTSTTDLAPVSTPASTSTNDLAAMFRPSTGSWSCDSCLLQNKSDAAECVACQTPKPGKKETAQKPVKKKWTCEVCLVPNEESVTVCVACQTEKPAKPFSHPPGDWTCDTCMFTNRAAAIRCCNCEYIRPGPPRTQTVPSCVKTYLDAKHNKAEVGKATVALTNSTAFKLGSTAPSSGVNSLTTGGFKFDSSNVTGSSLGAGIKFGNSASNSDSQPAGTGFKLANTSVSETQSLGTGFKFGNSSVSGKSESIGGFKFGNSSSSVSVTSQSSAVGFQIGNTALTSSSSSSSKPTESSFKVNNTSAFSSSDTQSKGLSFQFGNAQTSASSSSGFVFGNSTVTASAITSPKTASASANSVPSLGSTSTLPVGGFNFGQNIGSEKDHLKATLSVPGGFNFNSPVSSARTTVTSCSRTGFTANSTIGGFSFSATKTNTNTVNSVQSGVSTTSPIGGFTFATKLPTAEGSQSTSAPQQPKPVENAAQGFAGGFSGAQIPAGTGAPQQPKPVENATPGFNPGGFGFNAAPAEPPKPSPFGGFGGAQKPADNTPAGFGGFNYKPAETEAPKPSTFGSFPSAQGPSTSFGQPSPAKRSADDDSSEQSAKKPAGFNFTAGSSGSNPPFQLPGASNGMFAFGAQATTSAFPATTSGVFAFGARPAQAPAPTAPAPAPAGFNFGQAPTMNFTAGAAPAPGSFAFSAAPTTGDGSRRIKKAVRRIKRT